MKDVRVRFAPSPTGPLHMGGVRTALYNYLFAKKLKGKMILRIEDTDQNRFVPGAEDYIIESLNWCGIKFDEGVHVGGPYAPYRQSERKLLYKQYADKLIAEGNAYYAFDTAEDLENKRKEFESVKKTFQYGIDTRMMMKNSFSMSKSEVDEQISSGKPFVVRFKIPENEEIKVTDNIRGLVTFNSSLLDDKVIYKSDGMPTYHLANVVDDYLMKISHVIRGEEWLPSAPLHVLLYRYLGWEKDMPEFAHLPLLLKPDGNGKLSKRDGDRLGFPVFPLKWTDPFTKEISSGYRENGYLAEAFVNMIALLGWNPGTEQEIFSMEELIQAFSIAKVGKSGSKFDPEKAKWFNHKYLQQLDEKIIVKEFKNILNQKNISATDDFIGKIVSLFKERANFIADIWDQSSFMFVKPTTYDEKMVKDKWKENTANYMLQINNILEKIENFSEENIHNQINLFIESNKIGAGQVLAPLRLVIVGSGKGPEVFKIMALLGKDDVLERINYAIKKFQSKFTN